MNLKKKRAYHYIARDKDGALFLFEIEPILSVDEGKFVTSEWLQYIEDNDGTYDTVTFENSPVKLEEVIVC